MIKKTGTYKGKSNKPGGGGRFAQTVDAIVKSGVPAGEARAIAAKQGRAKYGAKKFAQMAATGRKRQSKKGK